MLEEEKIRENIFKCAKAARESNPMAPSITNFVTIDFVANAQLAVGGSAAMVYLPDEGEMLSAGQSMYLNVGTLMPIHEQSITRTAKALHENKTPWVLDPVGIGIGSLRTELLKSCKECKPTIIRCNASEAIELAKLWGLNSQSDTAGAMETQGDNSDSEEAQDGATGAGQTLGNGARGAEEPGAWDVEEPEVRGADEPGAWDVEAHDTKSQGSGVRGVDSTDSVSSARKAAVSLARYIGGAVAVSGEEDMVTDGQSVVFIEGGSKYMTSITGCGCALGGVCAVYAACADTFTAALTSTIIFDLAGLNVQDHCDGPASFKVAFLDYLYNAKNEDISTYPFHIEIA